MAYFTRSRVCSEHKAAGVLPFSLHEGVVVVLLGGEPCKTGPKGKVWRTMWRDFGGCREAADSDSEATAAREFAEETLGLFGAPGVDAASVALAAADMEARLHAPGMAIKVVHALKRGAYHFFITQLPFVAPLMFRLASQQNAATGAVPGAEKSAFAWVPLRALLECVAMAAPRYFLEARAQVCGGPDTPPPLRCGRRRFQLHPCFASSLRMAQKQGLEELIGRAQELPLPPPPPLLPPSLAAALVVPEPAASARGGGTAEGEPTVLDSQPATPHSLAVATELVAAQSTGQREAEATAAAEGDDGSSGPVDAGLHNSLAYLLARDDVAAALQGSGSPPPPALGPASSSQQTLPSGEDRGLQQCSLPAGRTGWPCVVAAGAPSSSSLAPASSLDSASSLRESQRRAAVEQVVQQIEANSHRKASHRLSRKQRLKRRRQRLQQQAEPAAAAPAGRTPSTLLTAAVAAMPQEAGLLGSSPLQPGPATDGEGEQRASPASLLPAPAPPHWQHAMRQLDAAFQPQLRLRKRLRLVVGAAG